MFTAAQFTIAKYWKQPKCPSANEWIQKLWYFYTMEFYAAERKKELIPFAPAWMELESIMLSEMSQAMKYKPYDLTFNRNLINKQTNKQYITRDTEIENRMTVPRGEGISGEKGEGFAGTIRKDTWTITG